MTLLSSPGGSGAWPSLGRAESSRRARLWLALIACLLALGLFLPSRANAPPTLPITGERVALVVGNAAYATSALLNPGNDARAIGQLLTTAGGRWHLVGITSGGAWLAERLQQRLQLDYDR